MTYPASCTALPTHGVLPDQSNAPTAQCSRRPRFTAAPSQGRSTGQCATLATPLPTRRERGCCGPPPRAPPRLLLSRRALDNPSPRTHVQRSCTPVGLRDRLKIVRDYWAAWVLGTEKTQTGAMTRVIKLSSGQHRVVVPGPSRAAERTRTPPHTRCPRCLDAAHSCSSSCRPRLCQSPVHQGRLRRGPGSSISEA